MSKIETPERFSYGPPMASSVDLFHQRKISHRDLLPVLEENYRGEISDRLIRLGLISSDYNLEFPETLMDHEGSSAKYILDFYHNEHRILVSVLGEEGETSTHHHEGIVEEYYAYKGELTLFAEPLEHFGKVDVLEKTIVPVEGLVVLPETVHWCVAGKGGAVTILRMRNARFVPEDKQHIHHSPLIL